MKKYMLRLKKNNKGISLVEILVTVAIIAIIATPLINSFISAMRTNSQASLIQNGTSVAQDVSELFKVFSVETLVKDYEDDGVTVVFDETTGKYTFEDIPVEGADGEDFLVTVELDPTIYAGGIDSEKYQVNDVNLPVFSGLYGSDCIVIYRQYAGFDEQLGDLFATVGVSDDVISNIDTVEVRSKITKSSNVNVACTYDDSTQRYKYDIKLEMTYVYDGGTSVTVTKTMEKTYAGDQIHNIYMICPVFDAYSHAVVGDDFFYNTDVININYTYTGSSAYEHDLYFYIAEQQTANVGYDNTKLERINPRNVFVNGTDYTVYKLKENRLKVYTNIGDNDDIFTNKYDLTYGDYNTGIALYEMNVTVKLDNKTIATFSTTK